MKAKILIQLDSDPHPSVFDRVVAVDAGVDELFAYGQVTPDDVPGLVHGAMFTRGPSDLPSTAIFIGGSDVAKGEQLLASVRKTLFSPMSVSVMLDANGANTTAAAAVLAVQKHINLSGTRAMILGGTGPVGQRVARLLGQENASCVQLVGRSAEKNQRVATAVNEVLDHPVVEPRVCTDKSQWLAALQNVQVIINAGAAGVELLPRSIWEQAAHIDLMIDLNAVAPAGIEGIGLMDKAAPLGNTLAYGAIGIGGMKMKIHKAALKQLFKSNNQVLNAEEIYTLAKELS